MMWFENTFIAILGLAIGSFLNVLIDRLPQGESIMGRSHCDSCKKTVKSYDLIPVISFITLGGKCRFCGRKLSYFYPFIELLTAAGFLYIWNMFPATDYALKASVIGIFSASVVIFFADLKYQIIPDSMQIAGVGMSLLYIYVTESVSFSVISHHMLGAVFVALAILLLFLVTRGRGMGFGDVKYAVVMGLLLVVKAGFLALYVAFITGAVVGLILIAGRKKKMKAKIAFGPFLVIGTLLLLFYNDFFLALFAMVYGT